MKLVFFNKRSGAMVMPHDSKGLGAAVVGSKLTMLSFFFLYIYISPYTLFPEVLASVMILEGHCSRLFKSKVKVIFSSFSIMWIQRVSCI